MALRHGTLKKTEPGWYMFEFGWIGGQTIQHAFNEAELDALSTNIETIKAAEPETVVDLMFIRNETNE